jgi:cephalosporin hydroxylase
MGKKMYTRNEFQELLDQEAKTMSQNTELKKDALNVLVEADKHHWVHQTTWMGEPILNFPQDMFALQEIIYKTRPKYIIEVGVAWGGALLFQSTLLEVLGGEKVIGIDIFIPEDLKERIYSHKKLSDKIELITGSSVSLETFEKVKLMINGCKDILVVLDSHHTHDHVLEELRLYSTLVGKGSYLVVGDTIIEDIPEQKHREREWGPNNNPKTALRAFLKENNRFVIDKQIENKLLFTCNPDGYLLCTED